MDIPMAARDFTIGQQVFAGGGSRLRRPAGLVGAIVGSIPVQTAVIVVGPAEQHDGLRWRRVRAVLEDSRTKEGWMAQTTPLARCC
jgi:hypothetical protein